jgi:EAL domain-containing protein (putative c-di-GMP-specific phosphodiesterase class I)
MLPRNTFLSVPLQWLTLSSPDIRAELLRPSELGGIVFELVGVSPPTPQTQAESAMVAAIQSAGGLIALQAVDIWHPDFAAVTQQQPHMVVVGADWVRGVETSPQRQRLIETLGDVAGEHDAWVLASGVGTAAALQTLTQLHVPLLRGPAVGEVRFDDWAPLANGITDHLGARSPRPPGPMRALLLPTPTAATPGDAVARLFKDTIANRHVVVIDSRGRPRGLAVRTTGGIRSTDQLLCMHVDTDLADAAARSATRRWSSDPVVAVDSAGRFLGLVPLDALVSKSAG